MMKQFILAAMLLMPAAAQANQIWQVEIDYSDRVQFLAPTPDTSYYESLVVNVLDDWYREGFILGFGEHQCSNACVANVIYKSSGFDPANPAPAVSPEPGTLALFVIGLIAGIGSLWNSRRIA